MRFGLLGPLEVLDERGAPVDLGGRQPRLVLAALLVAAPRPIMAEVLIDAIWAGTPPASATGTLQSYVSRLRRRLDTAAGSAPVEFADGGYRLAVDPGAIDLVQFETLADQGRALLDGEQPGAAVETLHTAEALWRGPALVEFRDHDFAVGVATRLEERRFTAVEDRLAAELAMGRHAAVVGELTALVASHPLREGLQAKLALALYRSGRQADALRALTDAGKMLRSELGIEPSRLLRDLEAAILLHDPSLDLPPESRTGARAAAASAPSRAEQLPSTATSGASSAPASAALAPALVGRDAELAQLLAALAESEHDARFVVVEGEPGIGKTRLADELRVIASERGSLAVWGRSDEGGAAPALWPWLAPLRALATHVGAVPSALTELFAGESTAVQAGLGAALQFERFEAVAELLERAGAAAPAVVLLDDLQWADSTSLELLAYLCAQLGSRVLVVATMRQLAVGRHDAVTDALAAIARRPGSRRLALRGLAPAATAAVLDAAAGHRLAPTVTATIHDRAEGNPFYAIELARLVDPEGRLEGDVPATVGDVIRRRLAQLPPDTVDLLGVGAVTGRDVDVTLLARAAGIELSDCLDTIEPAIVQRLLVDVAEAPGSLRFSHALVREVLLDGLTSLRRARLHLRVADALEAGGAGLDEAEILAEHLWQAAPVGVGQRAADALEQAAEVAVRRVSYAAAEELLTKAVKLRRATGASRPDQDAELRTIYRLLEVTQATRYFSGADRQVIARAKELAQRHGELDLLRKLIWYEWAALATAAQLDDIEALAAEYAAVAEDDPRPHVRSSGYEVRAVCAWIFGRITEAVELTATALALLEDAPPPDDALTAEQYLVTHTFWLTNHALRGDHTPEQTFAGYRDLVAMFPDRVALASVCGFAGACAAALGKWDEIERFHAIASDTDPKLQFGFWGGQLLMYRGIIQAWNGDVDAGIASFTEGRERYTAVGGCSGLPTFTAAMALVVTEQGRVADAQPLVAAAREVLERRGERWNDASVLIAEAAVAHATGDATTAHERLALAVSIADRQGAYALANRARAAAADLERQGSASRS